MRIKATVVWDKDIRVDKANNTVEEIFNIVGIGVCERAIVLTIIDDIKNISEIGKTSTRTLPRKHFTSVKFELDK